MLPKLKKLISLILSLLFIIQQSGLAQNIGGVDVSKYLGSKPPVSSPADTFRPVHLRYLSYDSLNNSFKLLLDQGSPQPYSKPLSAGQAGASEQVTRELLKYFFIGLTLPNSSFWVNLRPDAPDNIIDDDLAKTDIGKILLEADLNLKKDTSNWTSPQTPEGKAYWDKLYRKAGELYGTENITIPTLTRPWIVPDEIILRESPEGAYIYKATLKVMLEEDYLSRGGSRTAPTTGRSRTAPTMRTAPTYQQYTFSDPRLKELNEYSTQLIKELIIPKLTREINSSRRYAQLRQVYYSLILAQHFKKKLTSKSGPYSNLIDSRDLTNLTSPEPWDKRTYVKEYQKSFQEGEYKLKANQSTIYGQVIRRYMSGGLSLKETSSAMEKMPGKGGPPYGITKNMLSYEIKAASAAEPYDITANFSSILESSSSPAEAKDKPDKIEILLKSNTKDLRISDNPRIKRIWEEMVEENIELYKFAQELTRLSTRYGVVSRFPSAELDDLLSIIDLSRKDSLYCLSFITINSGIAVKDSSLLPERFKFNLLFLASMVYSGIKPLEIFSKENISILLNDEDILKKIVTGTQLEAGGNEHYIWLIFVSKINTILGKKRGASFMKQFSRLLFEVFEREREPYHEIARVRYAEEKPYILILKQYYDQLPRLLNSPSPREHIEQWEPVAPNAIEYGKIGHVVLNLDGPLLPGESKGKVRKFMLSDGRIGYAKRINPLRARSPEEEIMISLEVDKSLKKISPYFGVQEFIGIVYDRGAFYLLSLAITGEKYPPEKEKINGLYQFGAEVEKILLPLGLSDIEHLFVYKDGKLHCVFLDFETHPHRAVKDEPEVKGGYKSGSPVSPAQMLRWIKEILSAKKSAREIFSQLDEEERKYLMHEFDERMGYRFDPGSPGFLRGHVLADDKNMRKLLTVARELDKRFNKEGFSYIYILGRSLRFVGKALEFLNNPGDKAYAHIPFSGGWYENMSGLGDLVETPDRPEAAQVEAYGESLSRIGFDPQEIIKRPGKTVIMEYVDKGEGLKSFLSTLLELAKLKGMGEEELLKLKDRLTVCALVKKRGQEVNLSSEQFFDFKVISFQVEDELLRGMANTDEFEDSIGASYPMNKWQNPPEYEMTENAFLVLMRIVRYMEAENSSASVSAPVEERGGIDLTNLVHSVESSLSPSFAADTPIDSLASGLDINLDNELSQIQDMLNAGIMPASERIKEYALASSSLKPEDYSREIDRLFSCIADIFRLEEEKAKPTPQALKDALILLESNKPA